MKGHTASASQISNKAFGIIDGILSIIDKDRVGARSRFQKLPECRRDAKHVIT